VVAAETVRFGVFEFDPESHELRRAGRLVALEPQPARALGRLIASAGAVVSRDDLKDAIWGRDTHVDFDRGLAYCLSQVRAALGDSAENPRFVQTLPRRGYKFIAPVQRLPPDASAERADRPDPTPPRDRAHAYLIPAGLALAVVFALATWAMLRAPERAIVAVSIFDNETGRPELDRLVASLSDLVVVRLTDLDASRLAVVGNAAVLRQPRNIRDLSAVREQVRADFVLLGQLQRDDDGLRFVTHVIRLSDDTHLRARRILLAERDVATLEPAVVAEFERAVREHVLADPP
jgi:DNA-binding winged helix-turn-helix (wHTH) protein/TolB-like protein